MVVSLLFVLLSLLLSLLSLFSLTRARVTELYGSGFPGMLVISSLRSSWYVQGIPGMLKYFLVYERNSWYSKGFPCILKDAFVFQRVSLYTEGSPCTLTDFIIC